MGEKAQILQFRFLGVVMAAGTARLYHIKQKSAMGEHTEIFTLRENINFIVCADRYYAVCFMRYNGIGHCTQHICKNPHISRKNSAAFILSAKFSSFRLLLLSIFAIIKMYDENRNERSAEHA